jgi:hypothetical protein
MKTKKRLLDRKTVNRLALLCAADQLETIMDNSEYEDAMVHERGGTEDDTDAVKKQVLRIAEQLRKRSVRM